MLTISGLVARADHITGGEMYYTYAGFNGVTHQYNLTMKLYMRCNSGRNFPNPAIISIFNRGLNTRFIDISIPLGEQQTIELPNSDPCINNPPRVCFEVAYYRTVISLPPSETGYLLASQVNYRINGMANIESGQVGATYTTEIPGSEEVANGNENSSAVFTGSDLVIICANNFFTYSFAAEDADGDELSYSFCSAYNSSTGGINGSPTAPPPFSAIPYSSPEYSESFPLGMGATVDNATGMISGIAPEAGVYVVTVCVQEIRDGIVISTQRKDIQVNVADCDLAAATLEPDYMLCRASRTLNISNLASSPLILTQDWEVKTTDGSIIHTTTDPVLNYTFTSNGTYIIKLVVNRGDACADSTEKLAYVYPGFMPAFDVEGVCFNRATSFHDRTTTITGTVNTWRWDFGELSSSTDVSTIQHPQFTYTTMGVRNVRLIVTNTDGCRDTAIRTVNIFDKPPINLAFKDTLICLNDQLQLKAGGTGNYSWSPAINIINANTATPTVSPTSTTKYFVHLEYDGCENDDSVLVRVVDHVTLIPMPDSTICSGDTIQLRINSDGLKFTWTPTSQIIDPAVKNPMVITPVNTIYEVTATIGGCSASRSVRINAVPYPDIFAGDDETICYGSSVTLQGLTDGILWQWTPSATLSDPMSLSPIARPLETTPYIFSSINSSGGCPKPARDTVLITVLPEVVAFAGNDTSVVANQPLQLQGTGGIEYAWWPTQGLSSAEIANPIAFFTQPADSISYRMITADAAGCTDTAFVKIRVYASSPIVYVPSAFTPNDDGLNDILKPIPAGIATIEYFMIYNRWGQLIYKSNSTNPGWDGRINGQLQGSNTFVWLVKAVDYKGNEYFEKGTVTLIR